MTQYGGGYKYLANFYVNYQLVLTIRLGMTFLSANLCEIVLDIDKSDSSLYEFEFGLIDNLAKYI